MKRDAKAALMLTLEVGMTHDVARLTKLLKTHGLKVGELSDQIQRTGPHTSEETRKWEEQMIKRIQTLNAIVREIHELTKKMEQV